MYVFAHLGAAPGAPKCAKGQLYGDAPAFAPGLGGGAASGTAWVPLAVGAALVGGVLWMLAKTATPVLAANPSGRWVWTAFDTEYKGFTDTSDFYDTEAEALAAARRAYPGLHKEGDVYVGSEYGWIEVYQADWGDEEGRQENPRKSRLQRWDTLTEAAIGLPRFDFIAEYLAFTTSRKKDRVVTEGWHVTRSRGVWHVHQPFVKDVSYDFPDAAALYEYARRTPLNERIREAEALRNDVLRDYPFAVGDVVEMREPYPNEVGKTWRVLELRGPRVLVQTLDPYFQDKLVIPQNVFLAADLKKVRALMSNPKPKLVDFDIATRDGRETRRGYVEGDYATHKERGEYFWTFTHLPTGMSISTYPVHEAKESALAHLHELATVGPPEHVMRLLERYPGWGGSKEKD